MTNVVMTAIPLSFGSLIEYGEVISIIHHYTFNHFFTHPDYLLKWEVLTFFVAYLGQAEGILHHLIISFFVIHSFTFAKMTILLFVFDIVAAWGLLESLWDFFEAATSGLSEAASIRVAYHLGKGDVNMAKLSSYKSLFMGVSLSFLITSVLLIMGEDLPKWLTPDETLRSMLNDVIPLIAMANILMVFGMVSWTLVGAQGRYRLATTVSVCMSAFVTLPLAAVSTFYFLFDLKGIVGAIICG